MEMGTEVESTWKALFQRRVVMAAKHCDNVHGLLHGVIEVVDADVQSGRRHEGPWAEEAQSALGDASAELGLALASMGAARHLALRGGAPCPSAPLESVDDLAGDAGVWCALEKLESAAAFATRVHDKVEGARGHLLAAALLVVLDEVGVGGGGGDDTAPWEHRPCLSEQLDGAMDLAGALLEAKDLVAEISAAHEAAFGFSSAASSEVA